MDKPSQIYLNTLADHLQPVHKGQPRAAERIFAQAESTHKYVLSSVLHLTGDTARPLNESIYNEDGCRDEGCGDNYYTSNEPSLYKSFEFIKYKRGVGIGVGVDQMLDIFINTNLEEVYLIDISEKTHIASKLLLEVGRRHFLTFGQYPTRDKFLEYFLLPNTSLTMEFVETSFTERQMKIVSSILNISSMPETNQVNLARHMSERLSSSLKNIDRQGKFYTYLYDKSNQNEFKSWLSSDESIETVLSGYMNGKVNIVNADISGTKSMPLLSKWMQDTDRDVSVLYLSNAETYIALGERTKQFWDNLQTLPVSDDTILINTITGWPFGEMQLPKYAKEHAADVNYGEWGMAVRPISDVVKHGNIIELTIPALHHKSEDPTMYNAFMPESGLVVSNELITRDNSELVL